MRIRILTRVYRDLVDIWNYIANDNPVAADEQEERFFAAFKLLGEQPGLGHQRADVDDHRHRFWRVGPYQIAYRVRGKQLTICRVVHSARDFRKLF